MICAGCIHQPEWTYSALLFTARCPRMGWNLERTLFEEHEVFHVRETGQRVRVTYCPARQEEGEDR